MTPSPRIADPAVARAAPTGWDALLELVFLRDTGRTVLATRRHVGPLRVQKSFHPEGPEVCQAIVVHPPGGIVGGDSLRIGVDAGAGAHAQLTTPGAAKWYRSAGPVAHATTTLRVAAGAVVEWLPQETILFDGARASIALAVDVAREGRFIGWDVTCLGRTAAGEAFGTGTLRQSLEVRLDGELAFCERTAIGGGTRALQSGAVLDGAPVFGTMVVAGVPIPDPLLAACRGAVAGGGEGAVTRLPGALIGRYLGDSAHAARTYFATLWRLVRPHVAGREAVMPRIFST